MSLPLLCCRGFHDNQDGGGVDGLGALHAAARDGDARLVSDPKGSVLFCPNYHTRSDRLLFHWMLLLTSLVRLSWSISIVLYEKSL